MIFSEMCKVKSWNFVAQMKAENLLSSDLALHFRMDACELDFYMSFNSNKGFFLDTL